MVSDPVNVIIMGAAGRDFHDFNCVFRDNESYSVKAFTATQIPDISGRRYPPSLAGRLYPDGIPIHDESDLERLIREFGVDEVVFSYSDVGNEYVMERASRVLAAGADFRLLGPGRTALDSRHPVIAVCAVRTGCGKSQTSRYIASLLRDRGKKVAVVRHPMPYGDLEKQAVQRFVSVEDIDSAGCTIEEREEYEPHVERGAVVFAGVDYHEILRLAEAEADVIVWDGGNNDLPFFTPDVHIVVADPLRVGHERLYHPGQANARMADVVIINKADSAEPDDVLKLKTSIKAMNPKALIIVAASELTMTPRIDMKGASVLVVEDGPTLTHGGMPYGAGSVMAEREGASPVDPRPHATGSIRDIFDRYPHLGPVLPAMGYSDEQVRELARTIEETPADMVVSGTPIDLGRLIKTSRPIVRVCYELRQIEGPSLDEVVDSVLISRLD